MTKQEAIDYIKENCYGDWCEDEWREVHDMAIEALSCSEEPNRSEPKIADSGSNSTDIARNSQNEPKNGDLITKQSALDMIHKTIYGFFDIDDESEEPISEKDELLLEVNKAICNGIKGLQSAQPERKKGEWIKNSTHINCSVCKHCSWSLTFEETVRSFKYCPYCGADMRKPKLQYGNADTLQGGLMSAT